MSRQWDVFCAVVDNFGDAGVCWRLSKQLAVEYGLDVCLWIDQPEVLSRLCPDVQAGRDMQTIDGVTVCRWTGSSLPRPQAAVVIEAFACELPDAAVDAMAARERSPLWINLEYLSAEGWVEGSHGLWSVHARTGLRKAFFFPGFTTATGGLLRESGLEKQRQDFLAHEKTLFLAGLGLKPRAGERLLSLFAYADAPVAAMLQALATGSQQWACLIPDGALAEETERVCEQSLIAGQPCSLGSLRVLRLPFLSQQDYDRLLWACDLNIVRGEDSFVRAQWAGQPMLWQPYRQAEATHEAKLAAFLARYTAGWPPTLAHALQDWHMAWCRGQWDTVAWQTLHSRMGDWQQATQEWRKKQAELPDLASKLVQFYTDWL